MMRKRRFDRLRGALRTAVAQIAGELRRFNSGGIPNSTLDAMTRAERISAIKSAMHKHHDGPTRCC